MSIHVSCQADAAPCHPAASPLAAPRDCPDVQLVPYDPGLPPLLAPADPVSQCDCACYAVEGEDIPTLSAPVSFYLELTPLCSNHCPGCGNVFVQRGSRPAVCTPDPPLSANQWAQVLERIQPHACRLKLTGGEPTTHPEFETILGHVASLGVPFTLFTNGRWPDTAWLIGLLAGLPGFDGCLVSLHGPDAVSHEAFTRTAGSFSHTVGNLRDAAARSLPFSLSCIITHHNWRRADEMVDVAKQLGASSLVFNRYIGPAMPGLTASPEELKAALAQVRRLRARGEPVKFGNCLPTCFAPTGQAGCLAGRAFLTVDPWGRVRPCNHAPLLCGSLLQQPVEEIWASVSLEGWRRWQPPLCSECTAFPTCRGGCHAQALSLGLDADPLTGIALPSASDRPRAELPLFERARPVARYALRPEPFGILLMAGNRLLPVSRRLQPVLDALDGRTTLQEIEAEHGPNSLALVASLYQQGMVELQV